MRQPTIDPWLAGQSTITRLKNNYASFTSGSLKGRQTETGLSRELFGLDVLSRHPSG